MMRLSVALMIAVQAVFLMQVSAQPKYRGNLRASVHASVVAVGNTLEYTYTVVNELKSPLPVDEFDLEVGDREDIAGGTLHGFIDPEGWSGWTDAANARPVNPSAKGIMVWVASDSMSNANLLMTQPLQAILPGNNVRMTFRSSGLPSIKRSWLRGWVQPMTEQQHDSLLGAGVPPDSLMLPWYQDSYSSLTVSPQSSIAQMQPIEALDSLASFTIQSRSNGWIKDQSTSDKYQGHLNSTKTNLQQGNNNGARSTLQQVLQDVATDSTAKITSEACALLRFNIEYLLSQLPPPVSGCTVKLINSFGIKLSNGSLQFYDGGWKDAVSNGDGTFTVSTTLKTLSLRMTYEYGAQTKSNVAVGPDTIVFQTTNAQVRLQDSHGTLMDPGSVQYYAGAWRTFATTSGGIAQKELLPGTYSFRMNYAYGSKDKQQDVGADPVVVFQTVNAKVELRNSAGNLIDEGTVQYYAGAWRSLGTTSGGTVSMELLPANYSFRMTYEYVSRDIAQDLSTNSTVGFSTVLCTIRARGAQGQLLNGALVSYYSGAWRQIGTTVNGDITKELLPASLTFRGAYGGKTQDKAQDLNANALVEINMQP